jgi:sphingomyelin phosphodiesterase
MQVVLVLLKGLAELSTSLFLETLTELCIISKVSNTSHYFIAQLTISQADDSDVCTGAIASEGPLVAADLKKMSIGSKTSQLFCITFFGLCGFPPVAPYTVPFPSPKPATSRPVVSGQTPIQVVHFSDIHVDPFYETGASYNCTKPICCRPYTTADSPGNNNYPAGPYGNTNCDAPVSLEESMYAAIQSIAPNAAFTLFTGDIVDHAVWLDNETQNIKDINDAYSRMSGLVNVYGTAGNHEAAPANAFPPTALKTTAEQWVYDTLSADWTPWIGATSAAAADQFGAYSVLNGNLKIISINTNLYYKENYYLYEPTMETDPSGQLAWLVSELQDAETNGYRAYIIGHMPMGVGDAFHDGSNYFDQIVNRYSATIAALFFGHTHVDQFEIAYSDYTAQSYSNALEVSYIAPSMTPTSGSPAFRVYTVDPVTFGVLDITTYIANITSPDYQTTGPVWEEYYSAKSVYGPLVGLTDPTAELTPAFWHNVTVAFENDDAAFQDYETRKSRGYTPGDCTGTCKTSEICAMRAAQAQYNCATITPGISFKRDLEGVGKRDIGAVPDVGECEGSLLRPILAKLAAKDGLLEEAVVNARVKYLKEKH